VGDKVIIFHAVAEKPQKYSKLKFRMQLHNFFMRMIFSSAG